MPVNLSQYRGVVGWEWWGGGWGGLIANLCLISYKTSFTVITFENSICQP